MSSGKYISIPHNMLLEKRSFFRYDRGKKVKMKKKKTHNIKKQKDEGPSMPIENRQNKSSKIT